MGLGAAGGRHPAVRFQHLVSCKANPSREVQLLTEAEVQRSFRRLFSGSDFDADAIEKAEAMLEELRAESPLRHRLSLELDELRKLTTAKS